MGEKSSKVVFLDTPLKACNTCFRNTSGLVEHIAAGLIETIYGEPVEFSKKYQKFCVRLGRRKANIRQANWKPVVYETFGAGCASLWGWSAQLKEAKVGLSRGQVYNLFQRCFPGDEVQGVSK